MPDRAQRRAPGRVKWSRRVRTATVAVLAAGAFATACTAPAAPQVGAPSAPSARAAPTTPTPTTPPDAAAGCGDELAALDAVISEQLAAFAADDWDRAFSLTSRQFRAGGIAAAGLRDIVTSEYAEAADAERHDVLGCARAGDEAQVLIEVTAADGATLDLVYLLTREEGRWRISGAVRHGTGGSGSTTTPV